MCLRAFGICGKKTVCVNVTTKLDAKTKEGIYPRYGRRTLAAVFINTFSARHIGREDIITVYFSQL
jgi:hypothetical protein